MHVKKALSHSSNYEENEKDTNLDSSRFELKSQEHLQSKFDKALPIPFVLTRTKHCFHIIKNPLAIEIAFKDLVSVQIVWFYFN